MLCKKNGGLIAAIILNFIDRIEPWIGDGLMIAMQDGTEVISSRRQARELKLRMEF